MERGREMERMGMKSREKQEGAGAQTEREWVGGWEDGGWSI